MKKEIHPTWYEKTTVTCACGNTFTTGSTVAEIHVSICSNCHPIFTGQEKLIDTEGLVEKFQKRQAIFEKIKSEKKDLKEKKKPPEKEGIPTSRPRTLREMLQYAKKQVKE